MNLVSEKMEFRGISSRLTKEGKTVYNIALETENCEQLSMYLGENADCCRGLKKGDSVILTIKYNVRYGSISVVGVQKND
jgi:hypothetical protein